MTARRFAILDRDGTIITDRQYLARPEQVELLPNAGHGLRQLQSLGFGLIVVTNQSGLSRGYFDLAALEAVHTRMGQLLATQHVRLDAIYVCPHLPGDHCVCRKPNTGLVERAAAEFGFRPQDCIVVGDKDSDLEAGRAFGAVTVLVRTGCGTAQTAASADHIVDDLAKLACLAGRLVPKSTSA